MKRLTGYNKYGSVYAIGMGVKNNEKIINTALARLAAYEDTGLEPQEITETQEWMRPISFNRIREIMNAEAEGRLVVLPCKVGDMVYRLQKYFNDATLKSEIKIKPCIIDATTNDGVITHDHVYMQFSDFGETVFITREEAEEALRKER